MTVERAGLMGRFGSVMDELDKIREWHHGKGFHGALVLRDLSQPLYKGEPHTNEYDSEFNDQSKGYAPKQPIVQGGDDVESYPSPDTLHQRECYYLYYEVLPNGRTIQQIFCRGTTLPSDIITGLLLDFVWDEELECYLHRGFRDHANRLLEDVEPLLVPQLSHDSNKINTRDNKATVELAGHSLGGAVSAIIAMKLNKRGHNVTRVTTIASPRFCDSYALTSGVIDAWLPEDTIRIEDDLDGVPYLPPHGIGVGHKIWFVTTMDGKHLTKYVPWHKKVTLKNIGDKSVRNDLWWVESPLMNCRIPEILWHLAKVHRLPSYLSRIEELH
eukprot:CAMPEP_0184860728 /NCGR_PEP_ID=MMETSP0580-20130426/5562_1 /TAXON_ID=1118495 /ORGANISM="Dactyliosolen fragilissimus" /LENGTH=328 /DNA_ID=CAMNT_0027357941 /DNA_START=552 /DNA_END=1535 /DNA_ORIENTATION=-